MYKTIGKEIVFETDHGVTIALAGADVETFAVLEDETLTENDLCTLREVSNRYALGQSRYAAKDKFSVWTREIKIPDADPESFVLYLGGQCTWGQDKNRGYCFYSAGKQRIKNISLTGPLRFFNDRFGAYMREYAFDNRYVYFFGRRVKGAQSDDCRRLIEENVQGDALTGVKYEHPDYVISNGMVFRHGRVIPGADGHTAQGFSISEPGVASLGIVLDKNGFYHEGELFTPELNPALYKRIPKVLFDLQKTLREA